MFAKFEVRLFPPELGLGTTFLMFGVVPLRSGSP